MTSCITDRERSLQSWRQRLAPSFVPGLPAHVTVTAAQDRSGNWHKVTKLTTWLKPSDNGSMIASTIADRTVKLLLFGPTFETGTLVTVIASLKVPCQLHGHRQWVLLLSGDQLGWTFRLDALELV